MSLLAAVEEAGDAQLGRLFRARSVAIVGASDSNPWPGLVAATLRSLKFDGAVHLVNRRGTPALGKATVESCARIGQPVDAAFIIVPASGVEEALEDAAAGGIRHAVVVTSGYAETGAEGAAAQARLAARARALGVTLLGPNSVGFVNFSDGVGLGAMPLQSPIVSGGVAVVSQSGATTGQLVRFAQQQGVGLSYAIAVGNEAMIDLAAVVEYLLDDENTRAIAVFAETIRNPKRFAAAARAALARRKPIVMLKVGRSALAAEVAQAHTGALVGDDRIFDAVCEELGVIRVDSLERLLLSSHLLSYTGVLEDRGLALASISGGACEIASDLGEAAGVAYARFAPATLAALGELLPDFGAAHNPLDVTGEALRRPEILEQGLTIMSRDPGVGLLACVYDMPSTEADLAGARRSMLVSIAKGLAGATTPAILMQQTIKEFSPVAAATAEELDLKCITGGLDYGLAAIGDAFKWSALARQPAAVDPAPPSLAKVRPRGERDTLSYLASRGVPVIPQTIARTAEEAAAAARSIAGPLALKILSPDIAHKTEVGGVRLDVEGPDAAAQAHGDILARVAQAAPNARIEGVLVSPMRRGGIELFVGVARDPDWGLALAVGLGGVWVELLKDTALRRLPVSPAQVRTMLGELKAGALLTGYRGGQPADLDAVAAAVAAIGDAALALGPDLMSLEINPLWVSGGQVECLDALAVWKDAAA